MNVTLIKRYRFEAAHRTPRGRGRNGLHGHSYAVEVEVQGPCDPRLGWLIDYGEISRHFDPIYKALDHRLLNEVDGMHDVTLAGVREWITERLRNNLPHFHDVIVSIIGKSEFTPTVLGALYFGFEAAHALPALPPEHKCFRMHGHSFRVCVRAKEKLMDEALIAPLSAVYDVLDHRCLNDIPGLENPTSEQISRWIWERLSPQMSDLDTVTVAETCTAECHYHGQ